MVTLTTADNALKTIYLGVVSNQLNLNSSALLSKIKQNTNNVYGNEIRKVASYGFSSGISAGTEDGSLPTGVGKSYKQMVTTLKNLYGTLEITDKAIRASQNSAGAFVNLLNDEMENLIKSSSFNLGRMLYGNGSGSLTQVIDETFEGENVLDVDSTRNLMVNMFCDYLLFDGRQLDPNNTTPVTITKIDREKNQVYVDVPFTRNMYEAHLCLHGSLNKELTGLESIFSNDGYLYGLDVEQNDWLIPYTKKDVGVLSEEIMQSAIDNVQDTFGGEIDFIVCNSKVRRIYQEILSTYRRNVDVMNLEGGFKAISYNGIPVVVDRFVKEDTMYMLNTKEFELCQLCDWEWIEDNEGRIIRQKQGYPIYTATLVKYADMICNRPNNQIKITGITGA